MGSEFGDGPLTLQIVCTKCGAVFELGKEGVGMAFITGCGFLEYLKFVQTSKCTVCGG